MADSDLSTVIETPFDAALSERYLVYALSTITARSLPDVRDGLKPVHRRLLWAMRLLRLDPAGAYKKSARVVGDVIGKYHRSEEHTSELQSQFHLVCRLLLEKKKTITKTPDTEQCPRKSRDLGMQQPPAS